MTTTNTSRLVKLGDTDLVYDRDYYDDLYGYYRYVPYWRPDYTYPAFPY